MSTFSKIILITLCLMYANIVQSQEQFASDSILQAENSNITNFSPIFANDSISKMEIGKRQTKILIDKKEFSPTPKKALIHALIFPGFGQIYNRKYWKLPIIYGGFVGVTYAVTWNGGLFNDYKIAYRDIVVNPEGTTSWHNFVTDPQAVLSNPSLLKQRTSWLKRRRDYFRRNRDLGVIIGVGLYALCILDAYVDASLYNFDVSPNLSLTVYPSYEYDTQFNSKSTFGLNCSMTF